MTGVFTGGGKDLCANVYCKYNEHCDSKTGKCRNNDKCFYTSCPRGYKCSPYTGDCGR